MNSRPHFGSTYRVQLNGLGFAAAARLVPFVHALGVETLYLSPIARARSGSTHGYDVTDPATLDPALGSQAEFEALLEALAERGMTALIDIVPNHMAASVENPYFADVLRWGETSPYAKFFDIDWDEQGGKVMLPVLGKPLREVLADGELSLVTDAGEPALAYAEHRFPVHPATVGAGDVAAVHEQQHYRLTDWRLANVALNYRRFFDINELIGIRQEEPEVFAATHRLVKSLAGDRRVAGFRVDHVDGMRDPAGYLASLRGLVGPNLVIEVEKILEADERLPSWPVDGTTGYEFAAAVVGLFVEPQGAARIAAAAARAVPGRPGSFRDRGVAEKRRVLRLLFGHQLARVVAELSAVLGDRIDIEALRAAVAELTAQLAVYRTYRRAGEPIVDDDRHRLDAAAALARSELEPAQVEALDAAMAVLCGDLAAAEAESAVAKWQQLTSPVAAKGVEDTALYDPGTLLAVADVGSDPDHAAVGVTQFHAALSRRQQLHPRGLSTLSTHDSKRSADVRCRLAVLSEMADSWEATITAIDGEQALTVPPDQSERRYLYETLVGAWPLDGAIDDEFVNRIDEHVVKAAREAKRHTSWLSPDEDYEARLRRYAAELLSGPDAHRRDAIADVVEQIECAAVTNSLAAVVIRAAAPGVPDVYQNDESWFIALVDPDNRRPIAAISSTDSGLELPAAASAQLLDSWRDGKVKKLVVRNGLRLRRDLGEFFTTADYLPLDVAGVRSEHVVAFARSGDARTVVCVVPRLSYTLVGPGRFPLGANCWGDTRVRVPAAMAKEFTDVMTGAEVASVDGWLSVAEMLQVLPVALLNAPADEH
jgi:(1->4)-alpha-D-glucan 1-alpha-D-glucosylmutase